MIGKQCDVAYVLYLINTDDRRTEFLRKRVVKFSEISSTSIQIKSNRSTSDKKQTNILGV